MGNLIKERTNEPKSKIYSKQRISIELQRSNAAGVMGTFGDDQKGLDEDYYNCNSCNVELIAIGLFQGHLLTI